jgi:hypothetical protein
MKCVAPKLRRMIACQSASRGPAMRIAKGIATQGTPESTAKISGTNTSTPIEKIWPPIVDEVLAQCPTAQEIDAVNAKISLSFEADPTAGQLVCTAADGSADLTREQKKAYNAILIMKRLAFDAPLPWTDQPLYDWFTSTIAAIRFRSDIAAHTCCGTPPTINIKPELHAFYSDRWTAVGKLMTLYIHEARHTTMAHQCKGRDNTMAEMGAYGVEALALPVAGVSQRCGFSHPA